MTNRKDNKSEKAKMKARAEKAVGKAKALAENPEAGFEKKKKAFVQWTKDFRWNKKNVTITVASVVLIILLIVLLVNVVKKNNGNLVDDNGVTYKIEDRVTLAMSSVKSTNPANSTDEDTYYLSKLVYSSLFTLDDNMVPTEDLVKSYQFDNSNNSLRLSLKKATFQDGKKVTADDIKFSVQAYQAAASNNYKEMVSNISSIDVKDDYSLVIYYQPGSRERLGDLVFPILPEHKYSDVYSFIYKKKIHMIGSGPYKASTYSDSSGMKLTSFEEYYGDTKAENTIEVDILAPKADRGQMVSSGNISMMQSEDINRQLKISSEEVKMHDFADNKVVFIGFNFLRENNDVPYMSKDVRKAVASAIDNEELMQAIYYNSAMLNDNLFYPNYLGEKSDKDAYPYSKKKAKDYLKQAGYKDRDGDGWVENDTMGEISLTFLVRSTSKNQKLAERIRDDVEKVGIHVSLSYVQDGAYESSLKGGSSFDMFLGEYQFNEAMDLSGLLQGTPKDEKYVFDNKQQQQDNSSKNADDNSTTYEQSKEQSGGATGGTYSKQLKKKTYYSKTITGENYTRYYKKSVNAALDRMNGGEDNDNLLADYQKLRKTLNDDLPYYTLFYRTRGALLSRTLQGTVSPTFWNIYQGCETWQSKFETTKKSEEQ